MKLHNHTPLPARLFRGEPHPDHMLATAVVSVVHPLDGDGLGPALLDGAAPSPSPVVTECGEQPGDAAPYRSGTQFWVLGHARPPEPTAAMTVELTVARQSRTLLVVGDRRWRADGTFTPPEPFAAMPLSYARAYGGRATDGGRQCVYALNPLGRGYVPGNDGAGVALPNIEWPDDRVQTWRCRPEVAGFAPVFGDAPLHLERSVVADADAPMGLRLTPAWFSVAHPRLVLPRAQPGAVVRLRGVRPQQALSFALPSAPARLTVVLGSRRHALSLALDTVGILADEGRVLLSYRASFRYEFVRHLQRAAFLEAA